ncbi:MAG: ABC transporter ATP-binding protein [Nitrospira sp.]|nr:ABC transporter ATP-binding protein [Nitrospira sp.]MDE0403783.1 ABC transporter ATP-binding protein [Nitrospira sp.]MDE0486463.1 ABC transporter ATP-binding protein [Nitrospira sp.]
MTQRLETSSTPPLKLTGVTFGFGRRETAAQSPVLKNVSFTIAAGEVLGILGPNGSGKSTLMKILMRILVPQQGTVEWFGQSHDAFYQSDVARHVAFVPQETQQAFPFTISEMVLMGRYPHHGRTWGLGWESSQDRAVAMQAMNDLGVSHLGTRLITNVSGGERQRAVIARALAQEPDVLLLDEPTAFLDLHHQLEIARIIRRLNRERGLTVVLVSHDLNLASQYCDRLLLLREGEIVTVGTSEDVIAGESLERVYGCPVLVDRHPQSGRPRVTLPV